MELELWVIILLSSVYFVAGFIDSIAGGGGLLTVPAFLLTGLPPDLVLGTNKLAASCGMLTALGNYARNGLILWKVLITGLPAVIAGGLLGSWMLLSLNNELLGKILVFLLPFGLAALLMPTRDRPPRDLNAAALYLYLPALCFILGMYQGFLGPGNGSFMLLGMHLILGSSLLRASATSKLLNLCATLTALAVFIIRGKVLFLLGLPLIMAGILGNYVGSKTAIKEGSGLVRTILMISLSLLFASLVWKFWLA